MIRKPLARNAATRGNPPLWKSFLQAITLLAVALATALYSTGASRAGDVPATIVASVASLVIALWVAIRFVPRLAQGVNWAWMPITRYQQQSPLYGAFGIARGAGAFRTSLVDQFQVP